MMKIILLVAFIGVASAQFGRQNQRPAPARQPAPAPRPSAPRTSGGGNSADIQILRSEVENNGDGTYSYRYELSDGTIVEERGSLKPPPAGSDEPIQVAEGSYQYYSPEGELIQVKYIADENGFQPEGAHLPTPPPIPPEIQKALEIIYRNAGTQTQGQQPSRQSRPTGRLNRQSRF